MRREINEVGAVTKYVFILGRYALFLVLNYNIVPYRGLFFRVMKPVRPIPGPKF